jgi:GH18 family chitinase
MRINGKKLGGRSRESGVDLLFEVVFLISVVLILILVSCKTLPDPVLPAPAIEEPEDIVNTENMADEEELPLVTDDLPISSFKETWGYLLSDRVEAYKRSAPLTDIGYFGAAVNLYGELVDVPDIKKIKGLSQRIHLVVVCEGRALSHFVLSNEVLRKQLVKSLLTAAVPFDGLQIDFEQVPARDGDNFRLFLKELKQGLDGKMLSTALPARSRTLDGDVYDYEKIRDIVDRILVMAYDEHWSGSKPGSVASLSWCRSVAAYALKTVGEKKLIMGLPFYGRAWGSPNPSGAYVFSSIERIKRENNITEVQRENGIPTFSYETSVAVTVYYEDDYSLSARIEMYRSLGVKSVGFWRLGQESPTFWQHLIVE